jgi:putative membrane protein
MGGKMVVASLQGFPAFLSYFCVAAVAVMLYLLVYTRITRHDEFTMIASNSTAASVALGLSTVGFALPLYSAIAHSANILDCAIWSVIALIVQVGVYFAAHIPVPGLAQKLQAGEMASAVWLGLISVTAGLLSAASMTY